MINLGGRCVFASDSDPACKEMYQMNFETEAFEGDIRSVDPYSIKPFDVLCAGFPCQPFSKAGNQLGFGDNARGNLFFSILEIIDAHPEIKFLIIENVKNLGNRQSEWWTVIVKELKSRDFCITEKPLVLSPTTFGIPQIRERIYILGVRDSVKDKLKLTNGFIHLTDLSLDEEYKKIVLYDAWKILDKDVSEKYIIAPEQVEMIEAWDEFRIETNLGVVGYPIWINYFGIDIDDDKNFDNQLVPPETPTWKVNYISKNRLLYKNNKEFIDNWVQKHSMLTKTKLFQKFEWNCGTQVKTIKDTIIQIRQSGIRAKLPTCFPSLVAMNNTPIIWDQEKDKYRKITPIEAAKLQSFRPDLIYPGSDKQIYSQLGNAVNVKVIQLIAEKLFQLSD
jgi:DNA (cytosine-5)-methyltransferase 1